MIDNPGRREFVKALLAVRIIHLRAARATEMEARRLYAYGALGHSWDSGAS